MLLKGKETLKWVPYFYYRPFFYFHLGIPTKCTSHFKNMRECKMSTEEGRVTSRDRKRTQGDHRRLRSDGRGRVLVTCTQHNDAQEHTSLLPDWPLFLYRCQCHFCLCRAGADVKAQCPTVSRAELLCLMVRRMECGWKTKESLKCPLLLPNDVAEGFFCHANTWIQSWSCGSSTTSVPTKISQHLLYRLAHTVLIIILLVIP